MPQQHRQSPLPHRISLERKLELLEARFTEPYDSDVATTLNSPHMMSTTHSFGFDTPVLMGHNNSNAGSRSNLSTSLHEVNLAAAKQMSKVAGSTSFSDSALEALSSTSRNASNTSTHTLITAHLSQKPQPADQTQVMSSKTAIRVQESPPMIKAAYAKSDSVTEDRDDLNRRKRKSTKPVKFEEPSVTENFDSRPRSAEPAKDAPRKSDTTRKRTHAAEQNQSLVETPSTAVEAEFISTSPANQSRESKRRNIFKGPTNNHLISNFFKPTNLAKSKTEAAVVDTAVVTTEAQDTKTSTGTLAQPSALIQPPARPSLSPPSSKKSTKSTSNEMEKKELLVLQQQCQELEQSLKESTEQLNAIRNHRSILHANLSLSLERCQNQLATTKETHSQEMQRLTRIVEEAVRKQAEKEAADVRERLAVDGVRLGQIVVQRVGMRTVEAWQDGQASKMLLDSKAKLKKERKRLERRKEAAQRALERILKGNLETKADTGKADSSDTETVGGVLILNRLEAAEAIESVEYHLSDLSRRERELVREEQAINLEKAAHVRGLKRVNSEDNSRFRSRPKLHDRYVLQSLLGKGGFSEVWRAYDLVDLCDVAVKIHQLDPRWSDSKKENYTKHISREYEIHKNVRHPRIVSLYDVFEIDNNSFATVLECCNGGDLDVLLKERKTLPERDARAILLQVLLGMQYLSQPSADGSRKGIIHYDLKPGNILFDDNYDAKITDFGLSKIVDSFDSAESMELTSQGAGTYWYLPPECFVTDDNVRISSKVDVWSIGTIYYQMLFGKRPFGEGQSQDRILKDQTMLNAHHVSFPEPNIVSQEGKDFIRTCLAYEQSVRPNIAQVCELPYLYMEL